MSSSAFSESKIKKPNVSGQFYEADEQKLSSHLDQFFQDADTAPYQDPVELIIAPHAGYAYSGQVAAHSFKAVSKNVYKTIVILAPSHFVGFDGISIWDEGGFQTPLGIVEVDQEFTKQLINAHEKFTFRADAFAKEHALEVELPFLQKTFADFKIVPVVMGQPDLPTLQEFAKKLKATIGDRKDVLIVVSTDLSHYHTDTIAREMDERTIKAIKSLDLPGLIKGQQEGNMEMCGFIPVLTALFYAKEKNLSKVEVLKYANSGDVSLDKDRVVGYVSMVIRGNATAGAMDIDALTNDQKKELLTIAEDAILEHVNNGKKLTVTEDDPRLNQQEGAFVTLIKQGQLRGCIGSVIGRGPLYLTVRDMAIAAASEDPRFNPVTPGELKELRIEVSVLSKPRPIKSIDEIKLGEHGVIISQGAFHSGLFLPEVATEWGFTKEEFLSRLASEKAGLPADAWKNPQTKLEIFTTTKFTREDLE